MVALKEPRLSTASGPLAGTAPNSALASFRDATQLEDKGDLVGALAKYDEAVRLAPDEPTILNNRGTTLGRLGRYEDAVKDFDRALRVVPRDQVALANRGLALLGLGRVKQAMEAFTTAIDQDGVLAVNALMNRGTALAQAGSYDDALADFQRATELLPDQFEAHFNKAACLHLLGRHEDALESINRGLVLRPDDVDARALRRQVLDAILRRLARRGVISWAGGKPKGSEPPIPITPGPPVSDLVHQSRR